MTALSHVCRLLALGAHARVAVEVWHSKPRFEWRVRMPTLPTLAAVDVTAFRNDWVWKAQPQQVTCERLVRRAPKFVTPDSVDNTGPAQALAPAPALAPAQAPGEPLPNTLIDSSTSHHANSIFENVDDSVCRESPGPVADATAPEEDASAELGDATSKGVSPGSPLSPPEDALPAPSISGHVHDSWFDRLRQCDAPESFFREHLARLVDDHKEDAMFWRFVLEREWVWALDLSLRRLVEGSDALVAGDVLGSLMQARLVHWTAQWAGSATMPCLRVLAAHRVWSFVLHGPLDMDSLETWGAGFAQSPEQFRALAFVVESASGCPVVKQHLARHLLVLLLRSEWVRSDRAPEIAERMLTFLRSRTDDSVPLMIGMGADELHPRYVWESSTIRKWLLRQEGRNWVFNCNPPQLPRPGIVVNLEDATESHIREQIGQIAPETSDETPTWRARPTTHFPETVDTGKTPCPAAHSGQAWTCNVDAVEALCQLFRSVSVDWAEGSVVADERARWDDLGRLVGQFPGRVGRGEMSRLNTFVPAHMFKCLFAKALEVSNLPMIQWCMERLCETFGSEPFLQSSSEVSWWEVIVTEALETACANAEEECDDSDADERNEWIRLLETLLEAHTSTSTESMSEAVSNLVAALWTVCALAPSEEDEATGRQKRPRDNEALEAVSSPRRDALRVCT